MERALTKPECCCRNCHVEMVGEYCHACGQKHVEGRLDTAAMFSQLFEALTESNSTIWQTLRKLTRNPGKVAIQYIDGGRAQYLNPIRFLLVTFTVYFSLMLVTGAQADIAGRMFLSASSEQASDFTQMMSKYVMQVVATQMDIVVFFAIPLLALLIRWQYFWSGRNYAETFTFICFVFGLGYLFAAFVVPFQVVADMNTVIPKNTIIAGLFLYGAKTFFNMNWLVTVLSGIVSGLAYTLSTTVVSTAIALIELYLDQMVVG